MRLTLRELYAAAIAKKREQWDHTSFILAMLWNAHRDPKKTKAKHAKDFHPLRTHGKKRVRTFTADVVEKTHKSLVAEKPARILKPQQQT